jgi:uncharacterized membrane protein (Fun14 family)
MRSNVAKIGDMALLDVNILLIGIFLIPLFFVAKLSVLLFNSYEALIHILNNSKVEQEKGGAD